MFEVDLRLSAVQLVVLTSCSQQHTCPEWCPVLGRETVHHTFIIRRGNFLATNNSCTCPMLCFNQGCFLEMLGLNHPSLTILTLNNTVVIFMYIRHTIICGYIQYILFTNYIVFYKIVMSWMWSIADQPGVAAVHWCCHWLRNLIIVHVYTI